MSSVMDICEIRPGVRLEDISENEVILYKGEKCVVLEVNGSEGDLDLLKKSSDKRYDLLLLSNYDKNTGSFLTSSDTAALFEQHSLQTIRCYSNANKAMEVLR